MPETQNDFDTAWDEDPEETSSESTEGSNVSGDEESVETESLEGDESLVEDEDIPEEGLSESDEEAEEAEESGEEHVDINAELEKLRRDYKALEGRFRAYREQTKESTSETPEASETPETQDDDEAFLNEFREKYSDEVVQAMELIANRRAQDLVAQAMNRVTPVEQSLQEILAQTHAQTIEAVHPDAYDVAESPEFQAWIESRPVHLKPAYTRIVDQGTPQEVISLLDEYKASVAKPKSKSSVPPGKVASATAVKNRRGSFPAKAAPDVEDFDSAWEEAPN